MIVLAQTGVTDISAWLIGTPVTVLAFLVVAFIKGWIVPGVTYNRCLAEKDKISAEVDRLHATIVDKVVPTLTRATDLMGRAAEQQRSA